MTQYATCPHCHKPYSISAIANHSEACPERAEIYAMNLRVMAHPSRPGYAVSFATYKRIQPNSGASSRRTLIRCYGSWSLACRRYGFQQLDAGRPTNERASELNAPLTDAERHACKRRGHDEFSGTGGLHSHWR